MTTGCVLTLLTQKGRRQTTFSEVSEDDPLAVGISLACGRQIPEALPSVGLLAL